MAPRSPAPDRDLSSLFTMGGRRKLVIITVVFGRPLREQQIAASQLAGWHCREFGRGLSKAAEQAPHRKTPAYFSIAFPGDDDPFDPVLAGAAHAIAGTAHCQDRESHASAAEARQKMEAVCQVSGVRRHRIHPREPKTPQRCFVDFSGIRWIRQGFGYDHQP
jgi:hypothetical protein